METDIDKLVPVSAFLIGRYYGGVMEGPRKAVASSLFKRFCIKARALWRSLTAGVGYVESLQLEKLLLARASAQSYREWASASLRLDSILDKDLWKDTAASNLYDHKLVSAMTEHMRELRESQQYSELLHYVRTHWTRNVGGIDNVNLYTHSYIGTKTIIDRYITESQTCIKTLIYDSGIPDPVLLDLLQQTRRNIGRTALVLSGGATFGLFHIGLLAALFDMDMVPRIISGTSCGAIVASIFCSNTRDEIPFLLQSLLTMKFNVFKDDDSDITDDIFTKLTRFLQHGTWFDNKHLVNTMVGFLGNLTFQEAYYKTGKILNITVSPASKFDHTTLLNYITAPNVLLWSAVCASCSVPGIFPTCKLYEKEPKTGKSREWHGGGLTSSEFMDGSVDNDLPISRLSEMFNVDHIIACQVNMHVFPFLKFSVSCVGGEIEKDISAKLKSSISNITDFFVYEFIHILEIGREVGLPETLCSKLIKIFSQNYAGNITILPNIDYILQVKYILENPTQDFLLRQTTLGARATWPKISMIKTTCSQEFALDAAIAYLRGKIITSSSVRTSLQDSRLKKNDVLLLLDGKVTLKVDGADDDEGHDKTDERLKLSPISKRLALIAQTHISNSDSSTNKLKPYSSPMPRRSRLKKRHLMSEIVTKNGSVETQASASFSVTNSISPTTSIP